MSNVTEEFGFHAGRVWKAISVNGPLTEAQLLEETSLREHEMYAAVGWLARENKIRKEGEVYCLDTTNLTIQIGENAGRVWHALSENGELDTQHISKLIDIDRKTTFSALGWLARENKIHLQKKEIDF